MSIPASSQTQQPTLIPHLICSGAARAMEFYRAAFGATELMRIPGPSGRLMHGSMQIGNSMLFLFDEASECGAFAPDTSKGSPVIINLNVEDVDATMARAAELGATIRMPAEDMFWGDRYGQLVDPFGHVWAIAKHIRDVSLEEIEAAAGQCGR